ncbi:hypothetical protein CT676_16000 [Bradyrhizobium sp. MOS001]|nr:hypothetical protein CT676_16000 [Bradyrhizobium sp. MOS001]
MPDPWTYRREPLWQYPEPGAKAHSKARTPVVKIAKMTKRTAGALRQKALSLGIGLGHQR